MKAIIFIGIQASGKTSFFKQEMEKDGFVHISMDIIGNRNKEKHLILDCIAAGKDFVIDNTNPTRAERRRYLDLLEGSGYEVSGYFFQSRVKDCMKRNRERGGSVPPKAIAATSNKLEMPSFAEGFDILKYICITENGFSISDWEEQL